MKSASTNPFHPAINTVFRALCIFLVPSVAVASTGGDDFTTFTLKGGTVRVAFQAPSHPEQHGSDHLVLYLLPNGSTIEQAMGRSGSTVIDPGFSNQMIASQTHRARELLPRLNITTAYVEADTHSWPAWRKAHPNPNDSIREIVNAIRTRYTNQIASKIESAHSHASTTTNIRTSNSLPTVDLIAHSGGGSFIWGFLNSAPAIPDFVQHIALLDANYSYEDRDHHGEKIYTWLEGRSDHRLIVLVYDDRHIILNGKPVISEIGGTWRATDRMARFFEEKTTFTAGRLNDFQTSSALHGRLLLARHPNPQNIILHSEMVRRNGFQYAITVGRTELSMKDMPFAE